MDLSLGHLLGMPRQMEVLLLIIAVLSVNIFDMSFLEFGNNLKEIWATHIDPLKFNQSTQTFIKTLLSGIVIIRTFTYHLYLVFLILMIWPALSCSKPRMMIPWLAVSAVKNLVIGTLTFGTGLYLCAVHGACRPACLQFTATQIIDLAPSFYMWFIVYGFFRSLKVSRSIPKYPSLYDETDTIKGVASVETRSEFTEDTQEYPEKSSRHRMVSAGNSAVVVDDIFKKRIWDDVDQAASRSLDSLLSVIASETDTDDAEEFVTIEDSLSLPEKAMKLLGITKSQMRTAPPHRKGPVGLDETPVYLIRAHPKSYNISESSSKACYMKKNKLLAQTSLYSAPAKPVRPTRSELKSPRELLKLKNTVNFLQAREARGASELLRADFPDATEKVAVIVPGGGASAPSSRPESSDVGCQVSTLSRRVLVGSAASAQRRAANVAHKVRPPPPQASPSSSSFKDLVASAVLRRDRTYSEIYENRQEFINHMNHVLGASPSAADAGRYAQDGYTRYLDNLHGAGRGAAAAQPRNAAKHTSLRGAT